MSYRKVAIRVAMIALSAFVLGILIPNPTVWYSVCRTVGVMAQLTSSSLPALLTRSWRLRSVGGVYY